MAHIFSLAVSLVPPSTQSVLVDIIFVEIVFFLLLKCQKSFKNRAPSLLPLHFSSSISDVMASARWTGLRVI